LGIRDEKCLTVFAELRECFLRSKTYRVSCSPHNADNVELPPPSSEKPAQEDKEKNYLAKEKQLHSCSTSTNSEKLLILKAKGMSRSYDGDVRVAYGFNLLPRLDNLPTVPIRIKQDDTFVTRLIEENEELKNKNAILERKLAEYETKAMERIRQLEELYNTTSLQLHQQEERNATRRQQLEESNASLQKEKARILNRLSYYEKKSDKNEQPEGLHGNETWALDPNGTWRPLDFRRSGGSWAAPEHTSALEPKQSSPLLSGKQKRTRGCVCW